MRSPIKSCRRISDGRWISTSVFDTFPIVLISGLLIGGYSLPDSIRRALVFEYTDPTLVTAYTAHFVHFTPSHLFRNLFAFVLASSLVVFFGSRSGDRWFLVGFFTTLLVILPLVLSFLNLAVPRNSVTYGFSGLNMALAGFLPIVLLRYIEDNRRDRIHPSALPALFFLSALYISIAAIPPSQLSRLAFVISAVLGGIFITQAGRTVKPDIRSLSERSELLDPLVVIAVGIWIALLSAGFPDIVRTDGSVINIYIHFLGYSLSFMVAYLAHEWRLLGSRNTGGKADRSGSL